MGKRLIALAENGFVDSKIPGIDTCNDALKLVPTAKKLCEKCEFCCRDRLMPNLLTGKIKSTDTQNFLEKVSGQGNCQQTINNVFWGAAYLPCISLTSGQYDNTWASRVKPFVPAQPAVANGFVNTKIDSLNGSCIDAVRMFNTGEKLCEKCQSCCVNKSHPSWNGQVFVGPTKEWFGTITGNKKCVNFIKKAFFNKANRYWKKWWGPWANRIIGIFKGKILKKVKGIDTCVAGLKLVPTIQDLKEKCLMCTRRPDFDNAGHINSVKTKSWLQSITGASCKETIKHAFRRDWNMPEYNWNGRYKEAMAAWEKSKEEAPAKASSGKKSAGKAKSHKKPEKKKPSINPWTGMPYSATKTCA